MKDASLDSCLQEFLRDVPNAPGIVVRAERAGMVAWTGAAGLANIAPPQPMMPNALFRTASVTKTFTAAVILRLWEQGLLHLEGTLEPFLPQDLVARLNVIDGVAYGSEITIRQLLQHTSGVYEPPSEPYVRLILENPSRRWQPLEQIELAIAGGRAYNRPGAAPRYSNTGYIILSIIIETVSGIPLAQAFRSLLRFNDLGLTTIHLETLEPAPSTAGSRMRQYLGDTDVTDLDASIDLYGGGGLVSDVKDLVGFWRALFEDRLFDAPSTRAMMCSVLPDLAHGREIGLGLMRTRLGDSEIWYHTGFWGSFVAHDSAAQVTIAGSTNQAWSHLPAEAICSLSRRLFELVTKV
jgi:D-alanyl-D-alanine carboxypeptidase